MVFPETSGDFGHSGLSVGLSGKKAELKLDANSSTGKGSCSPRSESAGSSDPMNNFSCGPNQPIRLVSAD